MIRGCGRSRRWNAWAGAIVVLLGCSGMGVEQPDGRTGPVARSGLDVVFAERADFRFSGDPPPDLVTEPFTPDQKETIARVVREVEAEVRRHFPELAPRVRVAVARVDRDLRVVGGVSGRADAPGELRVELAIDHPDGLPNQIPALRHSLFHEMHHLVRGWTITGNRFGRGIAIAAVNEGLAEVFAEQRTGEVLPANEYPPEAGEWASQIMALPPDADYWSWMFQHPDGRFAIGYRTGRYIVHQAMERSGLTIVELTSLAPAEILRLGGIEPGDDAAFPGR